MFPLIPSIVVCALRLGMEIISNYFTLKVCYIPMYINTDGRLPCTLRVYPQFNVSASYRFKDLLVLDSTL